MFNAHLLNSPEFNSDSLNMKDKEETKYYVDLLKMICEILNSFRESYVNLHCMITLSAFCKRHVAPSNTQYSDLIPSIFNLLTKLSSSHIGLDETSAVYLG